MDYLVEFKAFPARLDTVCEKWFNLHLQFKALSGMVEMMPIPNEYPGADGMLAVLAELRSDVRGCMNISDAVFTKVWETKTIDARDLRTDGEENLEQVLCNLDNINPAFRTIAARAADGEKFEEFKREN